jgi:hypothetical protein
MQFYVTYAMIKTKNERKSIKSLYEIYPPSPSPLPAKAGTVSGFHMLFLDLNFLILLIYGAKKVGVKSIGAI